LPGQWQFRHLSDEPKFPRDKAIQNHQVGGPQQQKESRYEKVRRFDDISRQGCPDNLGFLQVPHFDDP